MEETTSQTEFPTSISKEKINRLPLLRYKGSIYLVNTDDKMPVAIESLKKESIIGFDTESRPAFRKGESHPPALVQLAGSKAVYLFQIRGLQSLERLADLFSNPRILKAGVAIEDDIKKLRELFDFNPTGFVELSIITQNLGIINTGLRSLTAIFLKSRISKRAQTTNWGRQDLRKAQIRYAATDAWVSRELYLYLSKKRPCPFSTLEVS